MKLFSILAISVTALKFKDVSNDNFNHTSKDRTIATTFDEALDHFETRFTDMELRRFDNSERFLVKTTRKMYRLLKRWKNQPSKERLGCIVPGNTVPFDLALDPYKKCAIKETLMHDVYMGAHFFAKGRDPAEGDFGKCQRFVDRLEQEYSYRMWDFFDGKEMPTCEHLL